MNIEIQEHENLLKMNLKYKKVEELPNFPFNSFNDMRRSILDSNCILCINPTSASKLARWAYGHSFAAFIAVVWSFPFFVCLVPTVLAFMHSNYVLLLCPLCLFICFMLSIGRKIHKKLVYNYFPPIFLLLIFLFFLWRQNEFFIWFFGIILFFKWTNSIVTSLEQSKVRSLVSNSEAIFLALFIERKLCIFDRRNRRRRRNY